MELFRVGEALLRSPQPLLPFLAPSVYQRLPQQQRAVDAVSRHCRPQRQTTRRFTTTPISRQQGNAAARAPLEDPPIPRSSTDEISRLLDSTLDGTKGTPTALASRTSRFKSASAQRQNNSLSDALKPRNSVDEVLASLRSQRQTPSRSGGLTPSRTATSSHIDMDSIFGPSSPPVPSPPSVISPNTPLPIKLGPTVGRTVLVNTERGMDVGRAFRTLEVQCARNSVRRDFMRQRFHERPGLKRKRLKSERWRRRFRENFKGVVGLVQKMKAQGW